MKLDGKDGEARSIEAEKLKGIAAEEIPGWPTQVLLLTFIVTFFVEVAGLQSRFNIFGFGDDWLIEFQYIEWTERLGFLSLIGVFSVAAAGMWMLLCVGVLRLFKVHRNKAVVVGFIVWTMVLLGNVWIRQEIFNFAGSAFDFEAFRVSSGLWIMLRDIWRWFSSLVLLIATVCLSVGVLAYATLYLAKRWKITFGPLNRVPFYFIVLISLVAVVMCFCYFTLLSQKWPKSNKFVRETIIGAPFAEVVYGLTDFDGDGHSQYDNPPDTAPHDPDRHPYALEIPGDGIDNDLLAGDLLLHELHPGDKEQIDSFLRYPPVEFTNKRNVVIVLLESIRYDSLGKEVNGKTVTPNFRKWIAEGALAPKHTYASKGFTSTSVTEMFWGNYFRTGSTLVDDFKDNSYFVCVYSSEDELATGYIRNNNLDRADILFDVRRATEVGVEAGGNIAGTLLVEKFEEFLDERDPEQPFFAYFYFHEGHFPYTQIDEYIISDECVPRSEIRPDNLEKVLPSYYNQVYHADKACGKLVGSLAKRGLEQDTIFFFISDHGESLYDDGRLLGHGIQISEVMNHCVLVIKNATTDVPDSFSHVNMRNLIREMLTGKENLAPKVIPTPERKTFHYLSCFHSPSCIGEFSESHGRLVYDFLHNEIRDEKTGKRGRLDEKIDPELRRRAYRLIRRWEYLKYVNRNNVSWCYE